MEFPRFRIAVLTCACALASTACGASSSTPLPISPTGAAVASLGGPLPAAHPQAVEPEAGTAAPQAQSATTATVSVGSPSGSVARPLTDAEVRSELAASGLTPSTDQATLTPDGLAIAPIDAPPVVQEIIAAGNQIAHLPYVWGGGHTTYVDTGYDCSGSISFVFEAAHLLKSSVVSGDLMNWGEPGPGKWITIFANAGHTFMYVAGLRFDTVALAETGSRWSDSPADEGDLASFAVRHPAGL